ncbi:MAG: methyltransferase domain-containing protein [Desulfomonilaceae bacterium]|nr:methyltransferase domain-containing protein [Desulfomonilaceae bacterium]
MPAHVAGMGGTPKLRFFPKSHPMRDLGYSLRRHFVDQFHFRHVADLTPGALVLDLGGNRIAKRGLFDIEHYGLQVVYANLSTAKQPHVQMDAAALPFGEGRFHAVICSELLEHVPDPVAVQSEIYRVLRPQGIALMCVPFLNKIHGDPYDYGRYTEFFWSNHLERIGFRDIEIERHGSFWSVLVDMLRDLACTMLGRRGWGLVSLIRLVSFMLFVAKIKALKWDGSTDSKRSLVPEGYTTGFGITAVKA